VALVALVCAPRPAAAQAGSYEELQRFSAVLAHIRANHADSATYRTLVRAAIDGMLRSLDPHSWFASREDADRLNALERGELGVTGIEVDLADGVVTVLAVRDRSPADRAAVRPGDRIITVDGEPTAGLSARLIALRLAGDKGSRTTVMLERGPRLEPDSLTVTLRRENPPPPRSVSLARMIDDSVGLVRVAEFGPKAADQLKDAINDLRGQRARRIVIDLRGNPGGIVTEAVAMASLFLPTNTLVFSSRGRQRSTNVDYRTESGGGFRALPLVVLVDENSASAAEALAATLQDHDRAVIAGRRTFGKALMQTGFFVPDGYVQLTVGYIVSPSGRVIQRPYQGLRAEQYRAAAGDSSVQDTTRVFRTASGRAVRGGGGVAPDILLQAPPLLPRWFTVAADSGFDRAVADSVGFLLEATPTARQAWAHDSAAWDRRLVEPLIARVNARLGVTGRVTAAQRAALARRLAARAAVVRWDESAGEELLVGSDPDIRAALALFP
jgi:carboxyl-terminal processing protease